MRFQYCGLVDGAVFSSLTPFFKNNRNYRSLKIHGCDLGRDGLRSLANALAVFDSLKEFELSQCGKEGDGSRCVLQALLANHSALRKLCLREIRFGTKECAALTALLTKPESELAVLAITDNVLDDELLTILATGVLGNRTLRALDLGRNPSVAGKGWDAIFATLRSPACGLENLSLQESRIEGGPNFPWRTL